MPSSHGKFATHDLLRWLIYSLIILVPTIYHTGFDSAFTTPKLLVFRLVTLAIVAVWGLQIFAQGEVQWRRSPLNKWMLGYAVVLILATVFSRYFWVSFFGDQERFMGLMTLLNLLFLGWVVIQSTQHKEEVATTIKISVWTATVLALYGLLQHNGIVGAEGWDYDPTQRVFGTFGHGNHFGVYLAMHMMLVAGLLWNERRRLHKGLYVGILLLMFITLLATASRGAFFAWLVASVFFAGAALYGARERLRKHGKFIGGIILIVIIVSTFFYKPIAKTILELNLTQRTVSTIQFMREGNVPDRVSWWFSAIEMIKDRPVLGHGISTFRDVYNLYRRTDYRVPGDEQDTFSPEAAHMEYFHVAATQGLLGLFFYLGMMLTWFVLLVKVMRNRERSHANRITALSFMASGLVYFVQVLMSFGMVSTLVPLYILMGTSVGFYHITTDPKTQSQQFKILYLVKEKKLAFVLITLTLFIFSAWFTVRQASADYWLKRAERARNAGEVGQMLEAHQKAASQMTWMYEYWERYGENAFYFGTFDNDIKIIETLLQTSIEAHGIAYQRVQTMPYIQSNLGLAYVVYADVLEAQGVTTKAKEHREKGEKLYKEAVDIAVNNPLFSYNYAKLLRSMGRSDEALERFKNASEIRSGYQDTYYQIALIYTEQKDYESARLYLQNALAQDPANEKSKALLQRISQETSD